jgi:hypothetical protein
MLRDEIDLKKQKKKDQSQFVLIFKTYSQA